MLKRLQTLPVTLNKCFRQIVTCCRQSSAALQVAQLLPHSMAHKRMVWTPETVLDLH